MPVPDTDRTVAEAIDRVLEAEHAAAAAIAAAEAAARSSIEAAREERRRILERARVRITRLHERAEAQLARQFAQLDATLALDERTAAGATGATPDVVATIAERLTREASA